MSFGRIESPWDELTSLNESGCDGEAAKPLLPGGTQSPFISVNDVQRSRVFRGPEFDYSEMTSKLLTLQDM